MTEWQPAGRAGRLMKVNGSTGAAALLLVVSVTLLWPFQAAGQGERKELAEIESRINALRASIDTQDQRERSELAQLEQVEKVESLLAEQTRILNRAVAEQTVLVAEAERSMKAVEADFQTKKAALRERLVALYKMGEMSYARLFLSVEDSADLATAYAYISKLIEGDRQKVLAYHDSLARLSQERDVLRRKVTELNGLRAANAAKQAELRAERRRKEQAIGLIRSERTRHLQALTELEAAAMELRRLLNEMPPSTSTFSIGRYKGALRWPHPGKVILAFGLHRHPQFRTVTVQNGIDIDADYDDPVKAVFAGRVAFADWFRGYGNMAVIDHGDKYFSLYSHLARFSSSVGETVAPGQVIGYVGDTGSLKGAYLYFELRHGEKPLNPVEWLEKRKHGR